MSGINGFLNYCRCETPDENGRRSECGLPRVQCESCKSKDENASLKQQIEITDQLNKCLTEEVLTRSEENKQLQQDKDELSNIIKALIEYRGILTSGNELVITAKELLEKHKC